MKIIKVFIAFIFLVFIFKVDALAVSLSISGTPSTVDQSQDFQINVNLTCSGCDDSYIRGVFYPSGTSYFGYTQDNNGNWSNSSGSNCTTFFKVSKSDLIVGSWSGAIKFKPDKDSSYYNGPGEYSFKVGRYSYTNTCGSSPTWSEDKIIAITGPTPTPTSAPTATNTPTPEPTDTPTPTETNTPTPTLKPTKHPTPTRYFQNSTDSSVLGLSSVNESKDNSNPNIQIASQTSQNFLPIIFIALGVIFLVLCIGIVSYPYIKKIKDERFSNE